MGDTDRPIPERDGDQEEQAQHLVQTGNGPTVDNEAELLAERYGAPDMSGYYTGPDPDSTDDGESADQDVASEPAEPDTAADDTATGGESA